VPAEIGQFAITSRIKAAVLLANGRSAEDVGEMLWMASIAWRR
jgi:hypothetical protein